MAPHYPGHGRIISGLSLMTQTSSLIPGLRYTDGPAAIDFLCRAFGFTRQLVIMTESGQVAHAQLIHGTAMVMLGSAPSPELQTMMGLPADFANRVTATLYLHVDDPDAHYLQAKSAGAQILRDIADQPFGGRAYTCRDPAGHIWQFGSYDPWQATA